MFGADAYHTARRYGKLSADSKNAVCPSCPGGQNTFRFFFIACVFVIKRYQQSDSGGNGVVAVHHRILSHGYDLVDLI